jgi:hypothetical protein
MLYSNYNTSNLALGTSVNGLQQQYTSTSLRIRADSQLRTIVREGPGRFNSHERKQHVQDLKGRKRQSISRRQYAI